MGPSEASASAREQAQHLAAQRVTVQCAISRTEGEPVKRCHEPPVLRTTIAVYVCQKPPRTTSLAIFPINRARVESCSGVRQTMPNGCRTIEHLPPVLVPSPANRRLGGLHRKAKCLVPPGGTPKSLSRNNLRQSSEFFSGGVHRMLQPADCKLQFATNPLRDRRVCYE